MVILLLVIYAVLIAMWIELRRVKRELRELKKHTSMYVKINENDKKLIGLKNKLTELKIK